MWQANVAVVSSALMLSGCVTSEKTAATYNSDNLVAVSDITGAIKCAFATALNEEVDSGYSRLEGRVVKLELSLKIVDESVVGASAKAKAAEPFVFAASGGVGSILPHFGGSVNRTNTIETIIRSRIGLRQTDSEICKAYRSESRIHYGFDEWLATLVTGLNRYGRFAPAGIVDSVTYDGSFQVVRKRSGGVDFDIVFVAGDVSGNHDRSDVQHINMVIQAETDQVPFPREAYLDGKSTSR